MTAAPITCIVTKNWRRVQKTSQGKEHLIILVKLSSHLNNCRIKIIWNSYSCTMLAWNVRDGNLSLWDKRTSCSSKNSSSDTLALRILPPRTDNSYLLTSSTKSSFRPFIIHLTALKNISHYKIIYNNVQKFSNKSVTNFHNHNFCLTFPNIPYSQSIIVIQYLHLEYFSNGFE